MSNFKRAGAVMAAAVMLAILVSCFSLPGLGSFNPLGDLQGKASARASGELSSAIGLSGMTRQMMFNMLYAQIFFVGGFGADLYELAESQGTVWRIQSFDEDGRSEIVEAERALLKKMPNGDGWWYLGWKSDGELWEFEALMDRNLMAKKIRYYNDDVKRVEESVFEKASGAQQEADSTPPAEAPSSGMDLKELGSYSRGKETVKLGSGSYNAELYEWSFRDEEENTSYSYKWWVDPKAPGGLVKFEWTKSGSKERFLGELVSVKTTYKTKFNSY